MLVFLSVLGILEAGACLSAVFALTFSATLSSCRTVRLDARCPLKCHLFQGVLLILPAPTYNGMASLYFLYSFYVYVQ